MTALSYALSQPREVAIVGDPDVTDIRALLVVGRGGPPLACCRTVVRRMGVKDSLVRLALPGRLLAKLQRVLG